MFIEKNSTVDIFDHSDGSGNRYRGKVMDLTPDGMTVRNNNTGKTEVIPSADISKRAKSIPKSKAHLDMPSPIKDDFAGAKVPTVKVGDTFDADGKTYTVRQVMPDGTVWANDGNLAHDSNPDKAGSLLENYWDGKDRKFAPGEVPAPAAKADPGLEQALNQSKPDGGTVTAWSVEGPNSVGSTFIGTEQEAQKSLANYDRYKAAHTLKRQDYTASGWEVAAPSDAIDPTRVPDSAPAAVDTWKITGPNSPGTTFIGTKDEALSKLVGFERYNQYGTAHLLERQTLTPLSVGGRSHPTEPFFNPIRGEAVHRNADPTKHYTVRAVSSLMVNVVGDDGTSQWLPISDVSVSPQVDMNAGL